MKCDDGQEMFFHEMPPPQSPLIWVRDINPMTAEYFANKVLQESENDPEKPLVIYIDSPGGYIDSLMTMISTLESIPNPIVTVAMGEAASCGAVLLSHGDVRFASPYSRIMVHEATGGGMGNVHDAKVQVVELEYANQRIISLLAENCGKTHEYIQSLISHTRRDVYMSPEEAYRVGIVDKIGVPVLSKRVQYDVLVRDEKTTNKKRQPPLHKNGGRDKYRATKGDK